MFSSTFMVAASGQATSDMAHRIDRKSGGYRVSVFARNLAAEGLT